MKNNLLLGSMFICSLFLTSCSVVQATNQPEQKDLSVLDAGTNRFRVLAELGQPIVSEENELGNKTDVFSFKQGTNAAFVAGRAIGYGFLAIATLGISEAVASPIEGAIGDGADIQVRVSYDNQDQVEVVEVLRDDRWFPVQELENEGDVQ